MVCIRHVITSCALAAGLAVCAVPAVLAATATMPAAQPGAGVTIDRDADNVPLDETIKLSPALIELDDAEPGSTLHRTITVRNRRKAITRFELIALGLRGADRGDVPYRLIAPGEKHYATSAAPWLHAAAGEVTLPPRGVATIEVRIDVPRDARPGGHFGAVVVRQRTGAVDTGGGNSVGVQTQLAVPVLVRVAGGGQPDFELVHVRAPGLVWNREPYRLTARVRGTGDLDLVPVGTVQVDNVFGSTVGRFTIRGRRTLPDGATDATVIWQGTPWFGFYHVSVRLHPENADGPVRTSERTFWALPPLWLLALTALMIVGIVTAQRWARRTAPDDFDTDSTPMIDDDLQP